MRDIHRLQSFFLSFCSELRREKAWSRIHLVPVLMAEADRDTYRREQAQLAREKEIMKDVKGWEVSNIVVEFILARSKLIAIFSSFFIGWKECLQHKTLYTKQLCCSLNVDTYTYTHSIMFIDQFCNINLISTR